MKRICYFSLACLAAFVLAGTIVSSASAATPVPNSAVVFERVFNDCPSPFSVVSSIDAYPGSITVTDSWSPLCIGFANAHTWEYSNDDVTGLDFGNNSNYRFSAIVTLARDAGVIEGGIHIRPWWGPADGRFQARLPDGEVACFGGRLPFYTFTGNHGLVYTGGPIKMEIEYHANGLSQADPASIVYIATYNNQTFQSPELFFDEGNVNEDPPHGLWGALDPSYAGGVVQVNNGTSGSNYFAQWTDITWECLDCVTPAKVSTWGKVKALYR